MSPKAATEPQPAATEPPEPDENELGEDGEAGDGADAEPSEPIEPIEPPEPAESRRSRRRSPEPEGDPAEVQARKIDNAIRKYRKDLEGILGDLTGAAQCPTCDGFGLVEDVHAYVKRETTERCPVCGGRGRQETGSLVPDQISLPCEECGGNGWRYRKPDNVATLPAPTPVEPAAVPAQIHGWFDATTQTFHPYAESVQ